MDMKIIFLEEFGKAFVPKRIRSGLRRHFLKAGLTEVPYKMFGGMFYISLLATFVIYFLKVYPLFFKQTSKAAIFAYTAATWTVLPLLFSTFLAMAFYFYLDLRIYNRTKRMEDVLPDFLRFVSENLKGGMSFEKALWSSIRPEFDVLANEVRLAAKKVMTGQDVEDALHEFTDKYDSPILKRAFELILEGMKGGGRIADIIDRIIEDIEELRELKAEMRATNLSYVIFISFVVIIVAPALFTLSFQFLIVLKGISAKLGSSVVQQTAISLPISFGKVSINPDIFRQFSQYALAVISGFSGIIVSIINRGSIKGGVRLIPIYIVSSLIAYNVFMLMATSVFSRIFV